MRGSFCLCVSGMSLKIHGDMMCPLAYLRVGRVPNHWHVCKAMVHTSGCGCSAVALHPGMCVCVWGGVCTHVLGRDTSSTVLGSIQELGPPCWPPREKNQPLSRPFFARRLSHVSVPSFQVPSNPRAGGKMRTSRPG